PTLAPWVLGKGLPAGRVFDLRGAGDRPGLRGCGERDCRERILAHDGTCLLIRPAGVAHVVCISGGEGHGCRGCPPAVLGALPTELPRALDPEAGLEPAASRF